MLFSDLSTFIPWYTAQIRWLVTRSYNGFESLSPPLRNMTVSHSTHSSGQKPAHSTGGERELLLYSSTKKGVQITLVYRWHSGCVANNPTKCINDPATTQQRRKVKLPNTFLNSERKNLFYNTTSQFRWTQAIKYRFSSQILNTMLQSGIPVNSLTLMKTNVRSRF